MNNFSGVGRITKDLELRYSQAGKAVLNFTIAINRPFTNQNGDREADFINVVTFGKQAENLANFMSKGSQVGIEGRLQSRSYDNQEGRKIFVTEVVANNVTFLESKNKGSQSNNNQSNTNTPNQQQNNSQGAGNGNNNTIEGNGEPLDINDDDLPF